jgi:hypothetical protein
MSMRTFLGNGGEVKKTRMYLDADCLEIEEEHPVDIVRRRIYLDDVVMVTLSRRFGWNFLAATGLLGGICGLSALGFAVQKEIAAAAGLLIVCAAFTVPFVYRLITRVDVITIFGRRKRAEITFGRNKKSVQKSFDTIVTAVRDKIAATQARIEREKPVAVAPDVGPLPIAEAVPFTTTEVIAPSSLPPMPVEEFHEASTPPPVGTDATFSTNPD